MMELNIPESEQVKIDQAHLTAESSLKAYLTAKYGSAGSSTEILSNDAELNIFSYENSEIMQNETANYTGYFLAKVIIEGEEINARYSPTGSTELYDLGGADNKQTQVLQNDIKIALIAALPPTVDITVRAGSLLPMHDWLLDKNYDGNDWFSPIPSDGFCFIQINALQDSVNLSDIGDALSAFFSSFDTEGVYICAGIRGSESACLTWENSPWNPAALKQRLDGIK